MYDIVKIMPLVIANEGPRWSQATRTPISPVLVAAGRPNVAVLRS